MKNYIPMEPDFEFSWACEGLGWNHISNKISRKKFVSLFGPGMPFKRGLKYNWAWYPVSRSFLCEDGNEYVIVFKEKARNISEVKCSIQDIFLDNRRIHNNNQYEWDDIVAVRNKEVQFFCSEFDDWLVSKGCGYYS